MPVSFMLPIAEWLGRSPGVSGDLKGCFVNMRGKNYQGTENEHSLSTW